MYLSLDNDLSYEPSIKCYGGFFEAGIHAFSFHKNLVINPDAFLQALIAQASVLITKDPELFRGDLVNHTGKKNITIEGAPRMWERFVDNIHIENESFKKLLNLKFSTTTDDVMTSRYALIVATFAPYYNYCVTECGLRGVRVEGTVDDWLMLKASLGGFGFLSKIHKNCGSDEPNPVIEWINDTESVVGRCIELLNHKDPSTEMVDYWKGFVTRNNRSGGPYIGGHIAKMMLINGNGKLYDRQRKVVTTVTLPKEQLSVTIEFEDGPREYLVGNFFRMSFDDEECITEPGVRLIDSKTA